RTVNHSAEELSEPYGRIKGCLRRVPHGAGILLPLPRARQHRAKKGLSASHRSVGRGPHAQGKRAVEAGALAGVAGDAIAGYYNLEPNGVLVAIGAQLAHLEHVAAVLALPPELGPRAAPEMADAGLEREGQGFGVHPGEHQHLARGGIGDDGGDEAVGIELGGKGHSLLDLGVRPARSKECGRGSHDGSPLGRVRELQPGCWYRSTSPRSSARVGCRRYYGNALLGQRVTESDPQRADTMAADCGAAFRLMRRWRIALA